MTEKIKKPTITDYKTLVNDLQKNLVTISENLDSLKKSLGTPVIKTLVVYVTKKTSNSDNALDQLADETTSIKYSDEELGFLPELSTMYENKWTVVQIINFPSFENFEEELPISITSIINNEKDIDGMMNVFKDKEIKNYNAILIVVNRNYG